MLISTLFIGCGDDGELDGDEKSNIEKVLYENWKQGYEQEDMDKYLSAFWDENFRHESDNGTEDTSDDVILKSIEQEREVSQQIFARFKDIQIEISGIDIVFAPSIANEAKVDSTYKIQFVMENNENSCGYIGYYAEGKNTFTFKKGKSIGWRITVWEDKADSPQVIKAKYAEKEG